MADLDMGLYLYTKFLEVLYYRSVNCTTKVGVLIGDDTSFVPDAIVYILQRRVNEAVTVRQEVEINTPGDRLRRGID